MKTDLPLMKNVITPLEKSVIMSFGLVPASTTDAAISNKNFGSRTTAFLTPKDKISYIMDTIKSLRDSGLLIKVSVKR